MKRTIFAILLCCCMFFTADIEIFGQTDSNPSDSLQVDVLVIGGGGGGLAAAAAAKDVLKDNGRVLIVEKRPVTGGNSANLSSPVSVPGGTSGGTGFMMRFMGLDADADPQTIADAQYEKIIKWNHWRIDAPLVRRLILKSLSTTDWLWGLLSEEEKNELLNASNAEANTPQQNRTGSSSYAIVMTRLCENLGVEILCNTRATKLLTDESGSVTGALAEANGKQLEILAKGVILATGGFIGNEELMKKHYPSFDENFYDEIFLHGIKHTGDGILMAAEVGASIDATVSFETDFQPISWEMSPVDALRAFATSRNGEIVWLDAKGRRFADESETDGLNTRHQLLRKVYYMVFDENVKNHIMNKKGASSPGLSGMASSRGQSYDTFDDEFQNQIAKGYAIKTDTLGGLAEWIGCDPVELAETIAGYNEFCDQGYDNLMLKPAEFLVPLTTPPYYAIRNKLAIHLTHGPLRVSPEMEVVDTNYDPIPGLYAAGSDIGGTENDTYADVPRHSSTWAIASGRIAGENASAYSRSKSK